jgi:serine/threonine-protein phosphatase 2A regulatory subunit B'
MLSQCAPSKVEALFRTKLALCCVLFPWDDPDSFTREKDIKRTTLLELIEFVYSPSNQKLFGSDAVASDIVHMFKANIFLTPPARPTLPTGEDILPGTFVGLVEGVDNPEDSTFLSAAFPHTSLVLEFFLRFIMSAETNSKKARKFIDTTFCYQLIDQFDSDDHREREYIKTIAHRIYGKFMSHRSCVRKAIANVFFKFVYESESNAGIGELLEILGSVINGFALPLKEEHISFLQHALLPLHRPKNLPIYFEQLVYCVNQFIEKDPSTVPIIFHSILKSWPWSSSSKQVIFLNELEELLELVKDRNVLLPLLPSIAKVLGKCIGSNHFQVAERALYLFSNDALIHDGILGKKYINILLPELYLQLITNASGHWNPTVELLAGNTLRHYQEGDPVFFEQVATETASQPRAIEVVSAKKQKWADITAKARRLKASASI